VARTHLLRGSITFVSIQEIGGKMINVGMLEHEDFAVVVKNRAKLPKPWQWEIYRAGRTSPISRSPEFFATVGDASRAGKKALHLLLSECPLP
jgi:hypothetical protein